ncbi:phage tail protein [Burkholderia sp. S171]|uniref:phage tail protein n=1 Tax=Burkholderia sp. S171 TaxID=1641860 RepID=UPI00131DA295|nr:phage tail protein [Burkholderia sp. S171]
MAGETQDQSIGPLPQFYFSVDIGDQQNLTFQEVSGLDAETQVIEYRADDSKQFSTAKMPGIRKVGNVTLKKGVFVQDEKFWDWYSQIEMNTIKQVPVVIRLLDEKGNASMVWTLLNAWPTKITGVDLKSDGNEAAVETLEIAHEGMTIKTG